jgi:hypothetical protein
MRSVEEDVELGKYHEELALPIIRKKFKDDDIVLNPNIFHHFDYSSEGKQYELKTRFNTKNKYSTTMIPVSKVTYCKHYHGKSYFIFKFYDGMFYIRYKRKLFKTFEKKIMERKDRGSIERNEYVLIPVNLLKKIV